MESYIIVLAETAENKQENQREQHGEEDGQAVPEVAPDADSSEYQDSENRF